MAARPDGTDRLARWTDRLPFVRGRRPEPAPVLLDRRRIYVLPTRLGLLVGILLMAMLLGALNYNNNAALVLAFLLAAVVHNSVVMAHLGLSGLRLVAIHGEPVHAGGTLRVGVSAEAGRREREGLRLLSGEGADVALEGPAGARLEAHLEVPAPRRGWHRLERLRIATTRPLGLVRAWSWWQPDVRLLVYPALERPAPPFPADADTGSARPRPRRSGEEVHHLRDYRPGDAPRQIAWKRSARSGRLVVREHESGAAQDLVFDWQALAGWSAEARIRRLAAWVVEADRQGRRSLLMLPGERIGPGQGPAHRHACLKALALLPGGVA